MSGTQRFFANDRNLIATATLTASSVQPVSNTVSETSRVADGYGTISLSGSYTGANDATFDILITSGGTAKHVSTAEYIGSGNGAISSIAATGLSAQTVTVECVSTGTAGQLAQIHLGDVRVKAVAAGSTGNGINVAITPNLTIGAAIGALQTQINAGETGWSGAEWDFGQQPLLDTGELPTDALRVVINRDMAHVYRLYKTWDGQNWRYNMTLPAAQQYRAGASVNLVTGNYTATLTKTGSTTETYSGHETLYSLLNAMLASSLITIDGAVINDYRPAGMGVLDVPWRTMTEAQITSVDGSEYVENLSALAVTASGVTQQAKIICVDNSAIGKERWSVSGTVSGSLGTAITGTAFDNVISFTIPVTAAETTGDEIKIAAQSYVTRTELEIKPALCLKGAQLGRSATAKTIKFTYTEREAVICDCANVIPRGSAIPSLLGIEEETMSIIDANYKSRMQEIYAFRQSVIEANTSKNIGQSVPNFFYAIATKYGEETLTHSDASLNGANGWAETQRALGWSVLTTQLARWTWQESILTVVTEYNLLPVWIANHDYLITAGYSIESHVVPTVNNNHYYTVVVAGAGGATQPTWPTNGGTVVSGGVTFKDMGLFANIKTYSAGTTYLEGELLRTTSDTWETALFMFSTYWGNGQTAVTFPSWSATDWTVLGNFENYGSKGAARFVGRLSTGSSVITHAEWAAGKPVTVGSFFNNNGRLFLCTQAGTTATLPDWDSYDEQESFVDGSVTWLSLGYGGQVGNALVSTMVADDDDITAITTALSIPANVLKQVYSNEDALALWDDYWLWIQADLGVFLQVANSGAAVQISNAYLERYISAGDMILLEADILPGKFEAGLTGNAVWQDMNTAWWIPEDASYLPLFTNVYYHTARRNANGEPESTMEAGFAITCGCPESLKEGDTVTISIGNQAKTYLVDDVINVAITGGTTLITAGGITAVDTITWRVGPGFADYSLTSGEPAYSNGGLAFQINRGGIPFVPGDKFYFDVENSLQFKWRKDAGAWSADTAIASSVSLSSGISATFIPGVAPSWIAGDAWSFSVLQPYSPAYVKAPLPLDFGWQWSTAGETLSVDLGSAKTITAVGILVHSLPAGATLALWGGSTAGATDWTEPLTWRAGPILALFSAHSSRYLRLVIGSATGGSVGWLWVGQPLAVSKPGGVTRRRYEHRMVRDGGINPGSRRVGSGWGATVEWNESTGWITQTDVDSLLSMIENCKANNDYPIVFLPTYLDTTEGMLVRIADDEIEIVEQSGHQPLGANRRINMSLEMAPVLL